jgi:hypothetical protein
MSGKLELINKTTISTSSNNIHIADVFSSKFNTYKIVVSNLTSVDSSASQVDLRFHDGSSTITTNYNYARFRMFGSAAPNVGSSDNSNVVQFFFGEIDGDSGRNTSSVGYIYNPFQSGYTFATSEAISSSGSDNAKVFFTGGVLRNTGSMTGYVLRNPNRNYDEGTILTYGIAD